MPKEPRIGHTTGTKGTQNLETPPRKRIASRKEAFQIIAGPIIAIRNALDGLIPTSCRNAQIGTFGKGSQAENPKDVKSTFAPLPPALFPKRATMEAGTGACAFCCTRLTRTSFPNVGKRPYRFSMTERRPIGISLQAI